MLKRVWRLTEQESFGFELKAEFQRAFSTKLRKTPTQAIDETLFATGMSVMPGTCNPPRRAIFLGAELRSTRDAQPSGWMTRTCSSFPFLPAAS